MTGQERATYQETRKMKGEWTEQTAGRTSKPQRTRFEGAQVFTKIQLEKNKQITPVITFGGGKSEIACIKFHKGGQKDDGKFQ